MLRCEIPAGPVRRSVCRSGRGGARWSGATQHRELALEAAREDDHAAEERRQIAAARCGEAQDASPSSGRTPTASLLGGYSGVPKHRRHGARRHPRAASATASKCSISEGCKITIGGSWQQDEVTPSDPEEDRRTIAEAAKLAAQADVIVLCIGGNEQTSREAWIAEAPGRSRELSTWSAVQDELVDAMPRPASRSSPCLFNGRPLSIDNVAEKVPAIFECWYLGQETRPRGRRGAVRRLQSRRQAADHDSALGRPPAGVTTTTSRRPAAAICSTTSRRSIRSASA